jgi:hypothetical protein
MAFIIRDWAGNWISLDGHGDRFNSYDDAEQALSEFLGDSYEEERQEYSIEEFNICHE